MVDLLFLMADVWMLDLILFLIEWNLVIPKIFVL